MRRFVLATIACGWLAAPAAAQAPKLDELPAALKPAGLSPYLVVPATGVQIYTCGKNDAGAPAWVFKAPEAALYDTDKKQIGKHYAGPTWEALAGGKVVGAVKANAPAAEAGAIPWLLLDIKASEGAGVFNQAKGILRIQTHGGVAPAQGCDAGHAGEEARVPYTAMYVFLK
jgi:Protein of unknown function (DUF3455)